jgi:PAS domain S-box-containing protein
MARLTSLSIRSLILLITCVVALPAGGIMLYSGIQFRNKMLEDASQETVKLTDRIASEQQNLNTGAQQVLTVLSQLPEVKKKRTAQVESLLRDLLKLNPMYLNIHVADLTGTVWASALPVAKPLVVADRRYFRNALETGRFSSGEYLVSRSKPQPGFHLAYPLRDDLGATVGVISINFSLEWYREMLERLHLPAGTSFTLVDHRGIILSRGINPGPYIGKPYQPEEFRKMQVGPESGTCIRSGFAGDKRIISYQKLRLAGESSPYMYVTAGIPVEIAAREANKSLVSSVVLLTSFLLLACAAAVLIGKRAIVDRFKLLEDASQRLAAGDLQVRIADLVVGGELGSLGKRFDFMAGELAKRETERLKAQEDRDRLIAIMETTTDVVSLSSPQGDILYLNRAGRCLTGVGEEALGALRLTGIHPDWAAQLISGTGVPAAIRDGVWEGETALLGPGGREVPVSQLILSHYDLQGKLSHLSTIMRDISERKLVERELEHKSYLLSETQKLAHLGSWELEVATGMFRWSDEIYRIFEITAGAFAGTYRAFLELVHPDDRARVQETCQKSVQNGTPFTMEHRLLMPDGRVKIVQERGETENRKGAGLRCIGSVQDITELRGVEEEQRKLACLVEMSRDFISIASLEGDTIYLNNAGIALVELESCREACSKKISDFFAGELPENAPGDILAELTGLGYWGGETALRNFATGDPIAVEATLFTISDGAGRPIAYANVSRDIRDRKAAEAEHELLTEQFIQAQKMESIGQLAGGVAHDFNNLLTPIFGYSEFLKRDLSGNDAALGKVANILKAAEKAKDLVQQLLVFSRKQALEMKTLDLAQVVAGFQNILRHTIRESIAIRWSLPREQYSIHADRNKIEQVLMNLAVNAQDAISGCGVISIEINPVLLDDEYARQHPEVSPGRYLMLALTDDGCGMDQKTRQRIFEPFFTTKGVGKGTGLGLATVYGIVRQHGGSLWVCSAPGKGTTFKCYFPLVDEAPQLEPALVQGQVALAGKQRTVLLVEDNEMVRDFVDELLVRKGFEVLVAGDPRKALLLAQQSPFDLLITDVVMPHMTGFELYAKLSQSYPGLKVLYMSGYTNDVVKQGADDKVHFIEKPFAINDFARLVETLLET